VTSLSAETGRTVTVTDMLGTVERHLADVFGATTWCSFEGTDPLDAGSGLRPAEVGATGPA
jgi:hypothetical protein